MPLVGFDSPSKRNKRKSNEPKRVIDIDIKRVKVEMSSSTSDGEDHVTTPCPSSLSPGSSNECRSPSPFSIMIPPKKRFIKDIMVKDINVKEDLKKSPFRPWMDNDEFKRSAVSHPGYALYTNVEQSEPLDLVKPKKSDTILDTYEHKTTTRNYKNMTKERRMEANARERQRVQAITESYDKLRTFIPIQDNNIKLSKLSIIKITTGYINLLATKLGYDYSKDKSKPNDEETCRLELESLIKEARAMTSSTCHDNDKD